MISDGMEEMQLESQAAFIIASALTACGAIAICLVVQSKLKKALKPPPQPMTGLIITGYIIALGLLIVSGRSGNLNRQILNLALIVMAAAPALMITTLRKMAVDQAAEVPQKPETVHGEENPQATERGERTFSEGLKAGLRVFLLFWLFYILYALLFAVFLAVCSVIAKIVG